MTTRDQSLVRRIRRGDAEAFDELVDRYQSPLLGYVTGMCGDPAAAEDIVQDLFLRLLHGLPGYRERGRLKSYLFTLARNATLDLLRRKPHLSLDGRSAEAGVGERLRRAEPVAGDDPQRAAELAEDRRRLAAALARLSETQREVILMHHFGGLTFANISKLTGVPLGTALARSHYGLRKLRGLLARSKTVET